MFRVIRRDPSFSSLQTPFESSEGFRRLTLKRVTPVVSLELEGVKGSDVYGVRAPPTRSSLRPRLSVPDPTPLYGS